MRFAVDGDRYIIVRRQDAKGMIDLFESLGTWETRRVLARALEVTEIRARIRGCLNEQLSVDTRTHGNLKSRLLDLLAEDRGRLVILRRLQTRVVTGSGTTEQLIGTIEPTEPGGVAGWVEAVVVDDDDQPCAYVEYEIELSDGRRRKGRTNEHGILHHDGIPEGTCKVRLLGLDESVWGLE